MANSAPYEVNVSGSDDETFMFSIPFETEDGSAFPFTDYAIDYAVSSRHGRDLVLTEGSGITIAAPVVTFRAERGRLRRGVYEHGCRLRNLVTGDEFQVFDGTVTISEGNFR